MKVRHYNTETEGPRWVRRPMRLSKCNGYHGGPQGDEWTVLARWKDTAGRWWSDRACKVCGMVRRLLWR